MRGSRNPSSWGGGVGSEFKPRKENLYIGGGSRSLGWDRPREGSVGVKLARTLKL